MTPLIWSLTACERPGMAPCMTAAPWLLVGELSAYYSPRISCCLVFLPVTATHDLGVGALGVSQVKQFLSFFDGCTGCALREHVSCNACSVTGSNALTSNPVSELAFDLVAGFGADSYSLYRSAHGSDSTGTGKLLTMRPGSVEPRAKMKVISLQSPSRRSLSPGPKIWRFSTATGEAAARPASAATRSWIFILNWRIWRSAFENLGALSMWFAER